jgi:tetratricopeptide (TPR) repeat protein/sugar lactone lactonase YvrE
MRAGLVFAGLLAVVSIGPRVAAGNECIYSSQLGSGDVVVRDGAGRLIERSLASGVEQAGGLLVAPDGSRVYVSDVAGSAVVEVDDSGLRRTISVGREPRQLTLTADGRTLFVANRGEATVSIVDLDDGAAVTEIRVGASPSDLVLDATGDRLFVACAGASGIVVVDLGSREVAARISLGAGRFPESLALHPNGRDLYVGSFGADVDGGVLQIVDVEDGAVRAEIDVGGGPRDIAFSRDGRRAYVADARVVVNPRNLALASESVGVVDTDERELVALIAVGEFGEGPTGIVLPGDAPRAFVSMVGSPRAGAPPVGSLVQIDLEGLTALGSVSLAGVPAAVAVGSGWCPSPVSSAPQLEQHLVANLLALAYARRAAGKLEKSTSLYRRAAAIDRRFENTDRLLTTLLTLAAMAWDQRDFEGARATYAEALRLLESRAVPDRAKIAAILAAAGLMDLSTGELKPGREKLVRSHRLMRELFGGDHLYTALAANNLAISEIALRHFELRDIDLTQMIQVLRASLGAAHPYVADVLNTVALLHQTRGHPQRGIPLQAEALEIRRRHLAEDDVAIGQSLSNLAIAHLAAGQLAAAEPLLDEALKILEARLGPDHSEVRMAKTNLAVMLERKSGAASGHQYLSPGVASAAKDGSTSRRVALLREAVDGAEEQHGDRSPTTIAAREQLALALIDEGNYQGAIDLYRQSIEARRRSDPDDPLIAATLGNLGFALMSVNQPREAEAVFRDALAAARRTVGATDPSLALSLRNFAQVLVAQGRCAEAEPILREELALRERIFGADHADVALALDGIIICAYSRRDLKAAAQASGRALRLRSAPGADQTHLVATLLLHGRLEAETDDAAGARATYTRVLAAVRGGAPGPAHAAVEALFGLGSLDVREERLDDARERFREAYASGEHVVPPLHTAIVLGNLADVERRLGAYDDAIAHFERTIQLAEVADRAPGGDGRILAETLTDYAKLREEIGDAAAARSLRARAEAVGGTRSR